MKKVIRLTEDDLTKIVKRIISEQQTNPNRQKMIDAWNKIIAPKLKSNGFKDEGGNPQFTFSMVKENNIGGYTHCVMSGIHNHGPAVDWITKNIFGEDPDEVGSFISYNAANIYDVPRSDQMEFKPPKCGTMEVCANRAVITAIKMSTRK
jgi:hypothetical protein